jgi:hypothetical protein
MTQLIRKQIYIEKRQDLWLKRQAKSRGISEAELIREALDRQALTPTAPRATIGDPAILAALLKSARARQKLQDGSAPYRWQRADAYEEREARFEKFAHADDKA